MIFKRKKRMIDIRELQRRGVVRIPKKESVVPTNKEGFVEIGNKRVSNSGTDSASENSEGQNVLGFMDISSGSSGTAGSFSTQVDGYNKREVDEKITDLDNKIYKLEQRIELLERKLGVNQPSSGDSLIGW